MHKFHLIQWAGSMSVASQWKISPFTLVYTFPLYPAFKSNQCSAQSTSAYYSFVHTKRGYSQPQCTASDSGKWFLLNVGLFSRPSPPENTQLHCWKRENKAAVIRLWINDTRAAVATKTLGLMFTVCWSVCVWQQFKNTYLSFQRQSGEIMPIRKI